MINDHFQYKKELADWTEKYEKAIRDGVFDEDKSDAGNIPQTSDNSFFGPVNTNSDTSAHPRDIDARWWSELDKESQRFKKTPSEVLSENARAEAAKKVASSPNPVRHSSVGADQDMSDTSLGVTYDNEDLEKIADLKVKLHDLEDKLNSFEGRGKSIGKLEASITALKEKINELCDELSRSDSSISPQGD